MQLVWLLALTLTMNLHRVGTSRCDVRRRGGALPTCCMPVRRRTISCPPQARRRRMPEDQTSADGAARRPYQVQGFNARLFSGNSLPRGEGTICGRVWQATERWPRWYAINDSPFPPRLSARSPWRRGRGEGWCEADVRL